MNIDMIDISEVKLKPSFIFKAYSVEYTLCISIGRGQNEHTYFIPWKKRFGTEVEAGNFLKRNDRDKYKAMIRARQEQEDLAQTQIASSR